jgi:hypothetical protein
MHHDITTGGMNPNFDISMSLRARIALRMPLDGTAKRALPIDW